MRDSNSTLWAEAWDNGRPIAPKQEMTWADCEERIHKLCHDISNASVAIHTRIDLLELSAQPLDVAAIERLRDAMRAIESVLTTASRPLEPQSSAPGWAELQYQLELRCQRAAANVTWTLQEDSWPAVAELQATVAHALRMLVYNACEHFESTSCQQGQVTVVDRHTDVGHWLMVSNSGRPLSGFVKPVDITRARRGKGHMGLGLQSVANRLVSFHGELRLFERDSGVDVVMFVPAAR